MKFDTINISDYIHDNELFSQTSNEIYKNIAHLNHLYPNFNDWYHSKVLNDISKQKREIIIVLNNKQIAGVSILKKTTCENKISTLYINKKYRRIGLGKKLIYHSLNYLDCDTPVITLNSKKYCEYNKILSYFNFKLTEQAKNIYLPNEHEYIYNGTLTSKGAILK